MGSGKETSGRKTAWKGIGLAAAVIALLALARFLPIRAWLASFGDLMTSLGPAGMLLFVAAYIVVALLLGPAWLMTVAAGLTFGLLRGVALVSFSSTTAAALAFLIARHFARGRVERLAKQNPRFEAVDRAVGEKGWKIVFLLRLSPLIPYTISNYFYGLTAIRFGPYLLASWLGMLPLTVLYTALGAAGKAVGGNRERSPWEWAVLAAGLLATIAVTVYVTRLARHELEKTRQDERKP